MRKPMVLIAAAVLSMTSIASAGNGIERTALGYIDFTMGKLLSEDLKNKTAEALEAKCSNTMASADNVILVNVDSQVDRVDQGVTDVHYVLSFRVIRDSLPSRMIRVKAVEFDVNSSNPEARVEAVEGLNCQ